MKKPTHWQLAARDELFAHPLLSASIRNLRDPRAPKRSRQALVLESRDWVNVIALRRADPGVEPDVLLVRQWRFGAGSETLEIPGGVVDPGEAPEQAARRELLEETGFFCGHLEKLGAVEPNPALFDNLCHIFLATDLEHRGDPTGDGEEEIEVLSMPLGDVLDAIGRGAIRHALVVAAFQLLERRPPRKEPE